MEVCGCKMIKGEKVQKGLGVLRGIPSFDSDVENNETRFFQSAWFILQFNIEYFKSRDKNI